MVAVSRRCLFLLTLATVAVLLGTLSRVLPTPHPARASGAATITSPANGSTLSGSSQTFTWTAGPNTTSYVLWVSAMSAGNCEIYCSMNPATGTSAGVSNLPTDSRPIFVRLFSFDTSTGAWLISDSTYTAAAPTSGLATIASPIAGATLAGSSQSVTWTGGSGGTGFLVTAGSTLGGTNYFNSGTLSSSITNVTVTGLPSDGSPVFIRLSTQIGSYQGVDYVFAASGSGANRPGPVTPAAPATGQTNLMSIHG